MPDDDIDKRVEKAVDSAMLKLRNQRHTAYKTAIGLTTFAAIVASLTIAIVG